MTKNDIKMIPLTTPLFFNHHLYTDCRSVQVLAISEDGNTAQVVKVRKVSHLEPVFYPGGFCGHTANNREMFSEGNYHIEQKGEPFILTKKVVKGKELWGISYNPVETWRMGWQRREDAEAYFEAHKDELESNRKEIFIGETQCGYGIRYYKLTPTGKRYNRWTKFWSGEMVDHCDWYYDFNF